MHAAAPDDLAALARVLAAARPAGRLLALGDATPELVRALADGMDLGSALVVVTTTAAGRARLASVARDELRLNLHHQPAETFVADVAGHHFDLILVEATEAASVPWTALVDRLADGAMLLARGVPELASGLLASDPRLRLARPPGDAVVLAARRRSDPPTHRRGGSRARRAGRRLSAGPG
ncbi:MAG: hypothetical protein H6983_14560 [Ectothiorhodospiraceae bacterium]|nr:hypothetical protein [Ectothiorhodospiraceae bacterium]